MTFEVKVIADSIFNGSRLTTLQLRYPRFIHSEFMTHRVFSRNASSSRAIPVSKMIEQVRNNPAMPIHWGKNQPGMQADNELSNEELVFSKKKWLEAAAKASDIALEMTNAGLHKQVANRILEPFQWISVVCTSSNWDNFFELRRHPDAQPEIKHLADLMFEALSNSIPVIFNTGVDYHLPYVTDEEKGDKSFSILELTKMSVARCARVSYLTHDGVKPNPAKDFELYDRLVGSSPIHASPTEHQARPYVDTQPYGSVFSGNFSSSWLQFRKLVEVKGEMFW